MNGDLDTAISHIDAAVTCAERGLPEPIFYLVSRLTPMVNVDLLIRDEQNRILLTWRSDAFYGPGWHIPGGIIRFKERWEQRIEAVAMSELGTTVRYAPQPIAVNQPMHATRAIRGHFISLLFDCRLTGALDETRRASDWGAENGQWAWHQGRPDNLLPIHVKVYAALLDSLTRERNPGE